MQLKRSKKDTNFCDNKGNLKNEIGLSNDEGHFRIQICMCLYVCTNMTNPRKATLKDKIKSSAVICA